MAQKLHEMANDRPGEFEAAQQFSNGQMLPRQTRQPQQQQQIQPQKKEE
jgi:hypothetical protein